MPPRRIIERRQSRVAPPIPATLSRTAPKGLARHPTSPPRIPDPQLHAKADHPSPIAKIREEIALASRNLQSINDQCEAKRIENHKLHEEKASLQKNISEARLTLDDLRSQSRRASQENLSLDADHATKKASHANTIRDLEESITRLKEELSALEPLRKEIETLTSIKTSLTEELTFLEKNISFVREENQAEAAQMEEKRAEVRAQIANLESLIEKNGAILTAIEKDRANLEIYVRRLQRYYDETGINLNILPEFGMTHYGQ